MMHSTQNLEVLTYRDYPKEPVEMQNISLEFMKKACFVPIAVTDGTFEIAMADTKDFNPLAALKFAYGLEIRIKQGKKDDILDAIDRRGSVPDVIFDRGGVGKEPMIRLLGRSPQEVLLKLKRIAAGRTRG